MNNNKNKALIYICVAIFGVLGVYLTFFSSNVSKYDSQAIAYKIDPNESYDSEDGTMYAPIYYFKHNGRDYSCTSSGKSSSYPSSSKKLVFYDSENPEKCMTEYAKSNNFFAGLVCLIVAGVIAYFFIIRKPSENTTDINGNNYTQQISPETEQQIAENTEKVMAAVDKIQLIVKRLILAGFIVPLLIFVLIDTTLYKQTIKSKDYIETTATYVEKKEDSGDSIFDDYIYTFKDKKGNDQQITVSVSKESTPEDQITITYDENNPQEFYEEGSTLSKTEITWYYVKIAALVLLIFLFFNKKLLSKIGISGSIQRG